MTGYYQVGELSRLFDISTDTLRYYEEIGVLVPQRAANNYRVYRTEDVWKLNVIRDLRDLDFPIETIRDYLQTRSIASTLSIISQELETVDQKLARLLAIRQNLIARQTAVCEAKAEPTGVIRRRILPARPCHRLMQGYDTDVEMDVLIKRLINFDKENLYIVGNKQIGSFLSMENIKSEKYTNYEGVFVLHEKGEAVIAAGEYLTVCYHGPCEKNSIYVPMLLDYAQKNHLQCRGPVLEVMWVDIHTSRHIEEQIIQLQLQVCGAQDS